MDFKKYIFGSCKCWIRDVWKFRDILGCISMRLYTTFNILNEHRIIAPIFVLTQCEPATSTLAGMKSHSYAAAWSRSCTKCAMWALCHRQHTAASQQQIHSQAGIALLKDFGWGQPSKCLNIYLPTHKITKYVQAIQVWRLTASIDIASCNGFPHFVWICIDWKHIICRRE